MNLDRSSSKALVCGLLLCLGASMAMAHGNEMAAAVSKLRVVVGRMVEQEEKGCVRSSATSRLALLCSHYGGDAAEHPSPEVLGELVGLCGEHLLPWTMRAGEAAGVDAEKHCLEVLVRALDTPPDSEAFRRGRYFWLGATSRRLNEFAARIMPMLGERLDTMETIKLYCRLPLDGRRRAEILRLLRDREDLQSSEADLLAVRARLGDGRAEERLLATFRARLAVSDAYESLREFDRLRQLCRLLGYAGTEGAASSLAMTLSSNCQYISNRGNESIKKAVLIALAEIYPEEFGEIFGLPVESWVSLHGTPNIANPRIEQIPACTDPGSLAKLEAFCRRRFTGLEWRADDLWFGFRFMIPVMRPATGMTVPMPRPVRVERNRRTVTY